MTIRNQVKQIAREVIQSSGSGNKYRLATVSALNDDGTCSVMVDGSALQASPLYPVTKGQQVAVILASDGSVSAVPLRPAADQVPFVHPPFFTGGGLRVAWEEQNTTTNPVTFAIRYQDLGTNKIFRWPVLLTGATVAQPQVISFSPDGTKSIYGGSLSWDTSVQGALPPGRTIKLAVVPLGKLLSGTTPIPSFPNGFFLNSTETDVTLIAGLDIAVASLPAPVDTFQHYIYEIVDVFVSNDASQIFWIEYMFLRDFTPSVDIREYTLMTLCTLISGNRTVIGSVIPDHIIGSASGSGLGGIVSQFPTGIL
jgi:hypothetical protein